MAKENRNRENSSSKIVGCMRRASCLCSWRGTSKCAKNRCKYYKDPRNPKNKKK